MNRKNSFSGFLCIMFCMAIFVGCDDGNPIVVDNLGTNTYQVSIIMPKDKLRQMKRTVDFWRNQMTKAQSGQQKKIDLNIRWIDESEDNWLAKVEEAVSDTTNKAIIGPYSSDKANDVASLCS